jgi:hypothetical protein
LPLSWTLNKRKTNLFIFSKKVGENRAGAWIATRLRKSFAKNTHLTITKENSVGHDREIVWPLQPSAVVVTCYVVVKGLAARLAPVHGQY